MEKPKNDGRRTRVSTYYEKVEGIPVDQDSKFCHFYQGYLMISKVHCDIGCFQGSWLYVHF